MVAEIALIVLCVLFGKLIECFGELRRALEKEEPGREIPTINIQNNIEINQK